MKEKIAVTLTSFAGYDPRPLEVLNKADLGVVTNPFKRKINGREILELCAGCAGILAGTEDYDKDILRKLGRLRVISRCGAGIENIDLEAAGKLGIRVFNTPDAPTLAVAELTLGLMLGLLRKTHQAHIAIKEGRWEKFMGNLLYGKKIGIIGFGRVGKKVAELLKSFSCQVSYADPFAQERLSGFKRLPKGELLRWADIISIHVSGKDKIIGATELSLMKKGSWLINTSRGGIVDEEALYQALKSRRLSGAALDVFEEEPYQGPLKELDNVILTSHIGSYAQEARIKMEKEAVENLIKGLKEAKEIK